MSDKKLYGIGFIIGIVIIIAIFALIKGTVIPGEGRPSNVPAEWVAVSPPSRLFTSYFPVSPERIQADLPVPGFDFSIVQEIHTAVDGRGNTFRVATFVYPQPLGADQSFEVLDAALQGMVKTSAGNKLLESATTTFKDIPAVVFMIQDDGGRYNQGEMFLKGRVLYQAFVTYEGGELAKEDMDAFLDSIVPTVDTEPAL